MNARQCDRCRCCIKGSSSRVVVKLQDVERADVVQRNAVNIDYTSHRMTAYFSPEPQPTFSCSVKDGARDMSGFTYAVVELKNPASYLQDVLWS